MSVSKDKDKKNSYIQKKSTEVHDPSVPNLQGDRLLLEDVELIEKISFLVKDGGIGEIEYTRGCARLKISSPSLSEDALLRAAQLLGSIHLNSGAVSQGPYVAIDPGKTSNSFGPVHSQKEISQAVPQDIPSKEEGVVLSSQMVGVAYLSPQPGADPFIKIGDQVNVGQTVMIVEAMKVMNPVKSETSGTVLEICVQDGDPVEFGSPLIKLSSGS